jgi:hypothetical protein
MIQVIYFSPLIANVILFLSIFAARILLDQSFDWISGQNSGSMFATSLNIMKICCCAGFGFSCQVQVLLNLILVFVKKSSSGWKHGGDHAGHGIDEGPKYCLLQ